MLLLFCGDFDLDVIGFTPPLSLDKDYALLGFTQGKILLHTVFIGTDRIYGLNLCKSQLLCLLGPS